MKRTLRTVSVLTAVLLISAALVACGKSKITKENYDKIMLNTTTYTQAKEILGKPKTDSVVTAAGVSAGIAVWVSGKKSITLTFEGNKVTLKTSTGLS